MIEINSMSRHNFMANSTINRVEEVTVAAVIMILTVTRPCTSPGMIRIVTGASVTHLGN